MKRIFLLLALTAILPLACKKAESQDESKKYFVESITFDDDPYTLFVGQTLVVSDLVTVLPNNAHNKQINWETGDSKVATVSKTGIVTAVGKGSCKIKATAKDGSGVTKTADLTVEEKETPVLVEDITFTAAPYSVEAGKTLDMTKSMVITPSNAENKEVSWKSLNTSIATVNASGIVTGVEEGTCKLLVSATDDSEVFTYVNITVTRQQQAVSYTIENASSATTGGYLTNDVWYVPGLDGFALDTQDYKTGNSSVKGTTNGSSAVMFCKKLSTPINAKGITKANGTIEFIFYVSDASKAKSIGSVSYLELTSAGKPDASEWDWSLKVLSEGSDAGEFVNGWNTLRATMTSAGITGGGLDLSAINFFRLYSNKIADFNGVLIKVDSIRIYTE